MPPQPAGVWNSVYNDSKWTDANGPNRYRRAIYTYIKRTSGYPSFLTFDASDHDVSLARRIPTNTPLQALVLLNDPAYVEAARALAERVSIEGGGRDTARIEYAFRLATARRPTTGETGVLQRLLNSSRTAYRRDRPAAEALVSVGESARRTRMDATELAAWTTVASTILNLDETITKQ
jgi:hypothetical protein